MSASPPAIATALSSIGLPEEKAVLYQEFFANTPINKRTLVKQVFNNSNFALRDLPSLMLHCEHQKCGGERLHQSNNMQAFGADNKRFVSVFFNCVNCQELSHHFIFSLERMKYEIFSATLEKVYQSPLFGNPIPKRLYEVIGEENRQHFLNARRCIARGLGIGAFTYYRRIIENHKFALVSAVLKAAKNLEAAQPMIAKLEAAIRETQFSKAIDMLKEVDAIPEMLLIKGHNPLLLLHNTLSVGIHANDDAECLERAQTAETLLFEMSDRIQMALDEKRGLHEALSKILKMG